MNSENNSEEFQMLKCCLQEISAYENDLSLSQMQEIYQVFCNSLEDSNYEENRNSFDGNELIQRDKFSKICNSTMIATDNSESQIHTNIVESGFQSSENISSISPIKNSELQRPEKIVVIADVHHECSFDPLPSTSSFSRNSNNNSVSNMKSDNENFIKRLKTDEDRIDTDKDNVRCRKSDSGMEISPLESSEDIQKY